MRKRLKLNVRIAAAFLTALLLTGVYHANVYAASGEPAVESAEEVILEDEDVPLAAAEDRCYVHWIILLLTLAAGGYNIEREFVRIKSRETDEVAQEA